MTRQKIIFMCFVLLIFLGGAYFFSNSLSPELNEKRPQPVVTKDTIRTLDPPSDKPKLIFRPD